ncbi:DUF732 domain-containing protein [Microbacterium sp. 3J1]|uniref:DUF732 domain-containing protein n=1 Tax=Microbacterium sp. 3J1 TaxID=861269 RepID=UPI000AE062A3|nr:DUF732 domain-containing protein [Microbacterium sp. 3J1]
MIARITAAVAGLALLGALTLAGCSGATDTTSDGQQSTETAAPLTAETAEPEPEGAVSPDAQYLTDVRTALTNGRETTIPNATDEQLVQAGQDACEQLAAGTPEADVRVVDGEQLDEQMGDYRESMIIVAIASKHLC